MIFSRTKVLITFVVSFLLDPIVSALLGFTYGGPNILLCASSILLVLYYDSPLIWGCALVFGIAYDICFSSVVGFATCGIIICMLGVLALQYFIYLDNIFMVPILAVIDSVGYNMICWAIASAQGGLYTFGYVLKYMALDIVGNMLVLLIFYLILRKYLTKHKNDTRLYKGF